MRSFHSLSMSELLAHLVTEHPHPIVDAIEHDLSIRFSQAQSSRQLSLTVYALGSRARAVDLCALVIESPVTDSSATRSDRAGYVIKRAHRPCEPRYSTIASANDLGPRVLAIVDDYICEDLLPSADNWRVKVAELAPATATALGSRLAGKFLKMIDINLIHRFDDFYAHSFISGIGDAPDVRWIDWARATFAPANERSARYLVEDHLAFLLETLRHVNYAPLAYRAFCDELSTKAFRERPFAESIAEAESHVTSPTHFFATAWRAFLKQVRERAANQ